MAFGVSEKSNANETSSDQEPSEVRKCPVDLLLIRCFKGFALSRLQSKQNASRPVCSGIAWAYPVLLSFVEVKEKSRLRRQSHKGSAVDLDL